MSRTPKSIAALFVAVFFMAGFAAAQPTPSFPIQENVPNCPPVLDQPLSMRDTEGILLLKPEDLDLDLHLNHDELAAGSDPTWKESTPEDPDADGADPDPCPHDARIPGLTFNAYLSQNGTIERGATLELTVQLRDANNQPTTPDRIPPGAGNPPGPVTCTIEYGETGTEDHELARNAKGDYKMTRPILDGDFAGDWFFTCEALIGGQTKKTDEIEIEVTHTTFEVEIIPNLLIYFENEVIEVTAKPIDDANNDGSFFKAGNGPRNAQLHVTTEEGVPLTGPLGQEMIWDPVARQWTTTFATDRIPDKVGSVGDPEGLFDEIERNLFDGKWTLKVVAEDDAPGAPNTGTKSETVDVTSLLVYDLGLSGPEDAVRGDSVRYDATLHYRGAPSSKQGGTDFELKLKVMVDGGGPLVFEELMDAGETGEWSFDYDIALDDPVGDDWIATATLLLDDAPVVHEGNPVTSNEVGTEVDTLDVELFVAVDQASYRAPGPNTTRPAVEPDELENDALAAAGDVVDAAGSVREPDLMNPTEYPTYLANAVGRIGTAATSGLGNVSASVDDNIVDPIAERSLTTSGEKVVILAYPLGEEGEDYFNDVAGTQPGVAHWAIYYVDRLDEDQPPLAEGPMFWVEASEEDPQDDLTVPHFRAEHPLGATDVPGDWVVVVNFEDDAEKGKAEPKPNEGEGSDTYHVIAAAESPIPPTVEIETINGQLVDAAEIPFVDTQVWTVKGTYTTRSADPSPTDVNQVWARIKGGSFRWVLATLEPGDEPNTGEWTALIPSQLVSGITTSGPFEVQAVAVIQRCPQSPEVDEDVSDEDEPDADGSIDNAVNCSRFEPNGQVGDAIHSQTATGHRVIYSETESALLDFVFPQEIDPTILGILGPDGNLLGNGKVLWDGQQHVLRIEVDPKGSQLGGVSVHIRRVAWNDCAPHITDDPVPNPNPEWCHRDHVTVYEDTPGVFVEGFNLLDPPESVTEDRVTETLLPDGKIRYDFTWDITDGFEADGSAQTCEDLNFSPDVEDTSSLVRRTSTGGSFPDGNPGNCDDIPEWVEDQSTLAPWQKTANNPAADATNGLAGPAPHTDTSRYWVWLTVETSKAFHFDDAAPETVDDILDTCSPTGTSAAAQACRQRAESAGSLSDVDEVTGLMAAHDAVQLRFPDELPLTAITKVSRIGDHGEPIEALFGEPGFGLGALGGPVTLTGTIQPNGNTVLADGMKLVFYKVALKNCVHDAVIDPSDGDPFNIDLDAEWCVVASDAVDIPSDAFDVAFDGAPDAATQEFSVSWTPPVGSQRGEVWFATVSLRTDDGDRWEYLPPFVDPRGHELKYLTKESGAPASSIFNWLTGLEHLCSQPCFGLEPGAPDLLPFLADEPGVLGHGYTGVSLPFAYPELSVAVSPVDEIRADSAADRVPCTDLAVADGFWSGCSPTSTLFRHGGIFHASIVDEELVLKGTASHIDALSDLEAIEVQLQLFAYDYNERQEAFENRIALGAPATYLLELGSDIASDDPDLDSHDAYVKRTLVTVGGLEYLDSADWALRIDTSGFPETVGVDPLQMARILAERFGEGTGREYAYVDVTMSLISESGVVTTVVDRVKNGGTLLTRDGQQWTMPMRLMVDRLDAPKTTLVSVERTTINTEDFTQATTTVPASELTVNEGGEYVVSGNVRLDFETLYEDGVLLGDTTHGLGKLSGVDVAFERRGPSVEFFVLGSKDSTGLVAAGVPTSRFIGLPMAIVFCPKDLADPDPENFPNPDACQYDGSTCRNQQPGANADQVNRFVCQEYGTRVEGFTIALLPVQLGLDLAFVRVDPEHPENALNPGDTTFGADLQANGKLIDNVGEGRFMDTARFDNYTGVNRLGVGVSGDLSLRDANVGATIDYALQGNHAGQTSPQSVAGLAWNQVGIDESCGDFLAAPSADVSRCYDPYAPILPRDGEAACGQDLAACATILAACIEAADGDASAIRNCFVYDSMGDCANPSVGPPVGTRCPIMQGQFAQDDVTDYMVFLVNRMTPLWMRAASRPAAECGQTNDVTIPKVGQTGPIPVVDSSCGTYPPSNDDPQDPQSNDKDFKIPRAFAWHKQQGVVVKSEETGVEFSVTNFTNVFASLDPASPDFGRIQIPDGPYKVILRGVDNTESASDLDDGLVPNDHGAIEEFSFLLENDEDGDGVSDLRETWLQARLQQDPDLPDALPLICEEGPYQPCVAGDERYVNDTTTFPDIHKAASNELDWDGDGVANLVTSTIPGLDLPAPIGPIPPRTIAFDLEYRLNMDPLVKDSPGTAANCAAFEAGSGPLGDRDYDCRPNIIDEKHIFRCTGATGTSDGDDDEDGYYCNGAEEAAGSDPDDKGSRPGDVDGDQLPDNQPLIEFLKRTLAGEGVPKGLCVLDVNTDCDGHTVRMNASADGTPSPSGIRHIYVDVDPQTFEFSVGYELLPGSTTACPFPTGENHCEVLGPAVRKALEENATALKESVEENATALKDQVMAELQEVLAQFGDLDRDGFPNDEELKENANPFYRYSYPDKIGHGFGQDWDADRWHDSSEGRISNMFQECSTIPNPNGWAPTKPTSTCEETTPIGGLTPP